MSCRSWVCRSPWIWFAGNIQQNIVTVSLILLSSRLFPSFIMIRCHVMRPCHSLRGNQMRATNFRLETWGMNWGHSEILTPSLHLLLTLAGNLVRKLFRVCLWTMQSQVRLIQKEAQHKRRSYACSDDCCYSLAIVVVDYPPPLSISFSENSDEAY